MFTRYILWLSSIAERINKKLWNKTGWGLDKEDFYCYKCWIVEILLILIGVVFPLELIVYILMKVLLGK